MQKKIDNLEGEVKKLKDSLAEYKSLYEKEKGHKQEAIDKAEEIEREMERVKRQYERDREDLDIEFNEKEVSTLLKSSEKSPRPSKERDGRLNQRAHSRHRYDTV